MKLENINALKTYTLRRGLSLMPLAIPIFLLPFFMLKHNIDILMYSICMVLIIFALFLDMREVISVDLEKEQFFIKYLSVTEVYPYTNISYIEIMCSQRGGMYPDNIVITLAPSKKNKYGKTIFIPTINSLEFFFEIKRHTLDFEKFTNQKVFNMLTKYEQEEVTCIYKHKYDFNKFLV